MNTSSQNQSAATAPTSLAASAFLWADVTNLARTGNATAPRRLQLSSTEWQQRLSPEQFYVLREKGTERAHSSAMCGLFAPGRYHCAGCDTPLFDAGGKFDSGTGWPSFTAPVTADVVAYHIDSSHGMHRVEVTCNVCDGHLGHVFPDGPAPTGLRYCINALALRKEK